MLKIKIVYIKPTVKYRAMQEYKIENSVLEATIKSTGAELISLKKGETEYIWQADKSYWGRHAPVLFPIVGKLKNDKYNYAGKAYNLSQHGFARDQDFTLISQSEDSISFSLKNNESIKKHYPFDFELRVTYFLRENKLAVKYEVFNTKEEELLFSIGGHPAFNCPMEEGQNRSEYVICLDDAHDVESKELVNGAIGEKTRAVLENGQFLVIERDTFDKDAIIFDPNPFRKATLIHRESEKEYLGVHFQGFPSLGLWSKNEESPFVCIEPWFGIADYHLHDGELKNKRGIIKLAKNEHFECQYAIKVYKT